MPAVTAARNRAWGTSLERGTPSRHAASLEVELKLVPHLLEKGDGRHVNKA